MFFFLSYKKKSLFTFCKNFMCVERLVTCEREPESNKPYRQRGDRLRALIEVAPWKFFHCIEARNTKIIIWGHTVGPQAPQNIDPALVYMRNAYVHFTCLTYVNTVQFDAIPNETFAKRQC